MTAGWSYYIEFRGQRIPLNEGTLTVGRSRYCDVSLDDPSISRKHIKLKIESGQVFLSDLGSSNGTVVNGKRIADSATLASGDLLRMGDAEVRLIIEAPLFDDLAEESDPLQDPLHTVRMTTAPTPGDATFFLQKASVELAQQAMDVEAEAEAEAVPPSPVSPFASPEPAAASETPMAVPATQALPKVNLPAPEPENPPADSESFADLLEDPASVDASPEFDEAAPFTFDLDAPSPFEVSPPDDVAASADASFADLAEPQAPWASSSSEPSQEPVKNQEPVLPDAPTVPDIQIDFSGLDVQPPAPKPSSSSEPLAQALPENLPPPTFESSSEEPQSVPGLKEAETSEEPMIPEQVSTGPTPAPPAMDASFLSIPPPPGGSTEPGTTTPPGNSPPRVGPKDPPTVPSLTDAMAEGPLSVTRGQRSQDILPTLDHLESSIGPQMPDLPAPQPPSAQAPAQTHTGPQLQLKPVGFWRRALAMILDSLWVTVLFLGASLTWEGPFDPRGQVIGLLVASGLSFIVVLIGWSFWGTTPGKRLARLYICRADGQPGIGVGRTLLRVVGYVLSAATLGVGFILIAFHPEKKGLHDLLSGTQVLGS